MSNVKYKINAVVDVCHSASRSAGWWTDKEGNDLTLNPLIFSNKLMLTVSELAEAMEADRKDLMDDKLPQYHGRGVELADAAIRIFDLCGAFNIDLGEIIEAKMAYNKVRPDHQKEAREAVGGKSY